MRSPIQFLCLLALGCGGNDPAPREANPPRVLRHDFGMIPHGEKPQHDFVVELAAELGSLVPIAYRGDCSCSSYQLILRNRDGVERIAPGNRVPRYAIMPDEQLLLRLVVDTSLKEPVDMAPIQISGTLVLQDPAGQRPPVQLGVLFTYGIDAPVTLRPVARLDFGSMPRTRRLTRRLELHGDGPDPVRFGPVQSSDDRLKAELSANRGYTLLEATFTPDPDGGPGSFQAILTVETDLAGYSLKIPVSGRILPDIEVVPMDKISLDRFDFSKPGADHFVIVTDNLRRREGWSLHSLRDGDGADASQYFEVHLEPLDGDPYSTRVRVEYTGGLKPPLFRGELILARDPEQGPFIPIELVAFHRS